MGLYECTVMETSKHGDLHPMLIDGKPCTEELVSGNAGKARMKVWRRVREYWPDFPIGNIRVRSLNKRQAAPMVAGWEARLDTANAIVRVIAKYGRHFLSENSDRRELVPNPFIAHFKVDAQGELWFVDRYSRKPVLVRHQDWPGFSDGGTLRAVVQHLAAYITCAVPVVPGYFRGDHWGYGDDATRMYRQVLFTLMAEGKEN